MKAVLHLSSFLLMIGLLLGLYQAIFPSISGGGARVSVFFPEPLKTEDGQRTALAKPPSALSNPALNQRFLLKMKGRLVKLFSSFSKQSQDRSERVAGGKTLSFFLDGKSRRFVMQESAGPSASPVPARRKKEGKTDKKPSAFLIKEGRRLRPFLEKYKNRSVWTVNLRKEAKALQALYPSKKPLLKRRFPDALHIYMAERRPVFLLLNPNGRFYPVFSQGKIGAEAALADLPVARGKPFQKNGGLRKQISRFLQDLPDAGLFSPGNVSEIFYKSNSFLLFLSRGDFALEIRLPLPKGAAKNINFVLDYLLQKEEEGAWINAERPEKIIVRRRAAPSKEN